MQVAGETTAVAGDYRTAAVFNEYGIDFCCGGRPIAEACEYRLIQAGVVLNAIQRASAHLDSSPRADALSALNRAT